MVALPTHGGAPTALPRPGGAQDRLDRRRPDLDAGVVNEEDQGHRPAASGRRPAPP